MPFFNFLKSLKKPKLTDPFPWDERTSLVIYASKSLEDNPDNSFPSLIYHEYNPDKSSFLSDGAPYLTALTSADMMKQISKWKNSPFDDNDYQQAIKTKEWVYNQSSLGWTHFLYETEPPKYAGNVYAWARYAEQAKKQEKKSIS